MAGRRVRRRRGTWLPNLGTVQPGVTGRENADASRSVFLTVRGDGGISQIIIPITFDAPVEQDDAAVTTGTPLGFFLNNDYFLERIVGNIFVAMRQRDNTQAGEITPGGVYCGAALFAARSEDEVIDEDSPIGSSVSTQAELSSYCPLNDINIREPWIWRRTWLLGNGQSNTFGVQDNEFTSSLPANNVFAYSGGSMNGPFIDAHTKRLIKSDNRLWWVLAARSFPINEESDAAQNLDSITALFDYRLYGTILKAAKSGTF